ncbi:MAG: hypothetical protein E7647_05600 [Ruminococcaceae bacterium]|nr:hypothetical protein [Oscillospiraceae bacterium]
MKRTFNILGNILIIGMMVWSLLEILALPAFFVFLGVLNSLPWQYYVISIGGYFGLLVIAEIVGYFVVKALDKKYTPFIFRKIRKFFPKVENK